MQSSSNKNCDNNNNDGRQQASNSRFEPSEQSQNTADSGPISNGASGSPLIRKSSSTTNGSESECLVCGFFSQNVVYGYGARVCSACKMFFYSKTNQPPSRPCLSGEKTCSDPENNKDYKSRRKCIYCRYQRCLALNMSRIFKQKTSNSKSTPSQEDQIKIPTTLEPQTISIQKPTLHENSNSTSNETEVYDYNSFSITNELPSMEPMRLPSEDGSEYDLQLAIQASLKTQLEESYSHDRDDCSPLVDNYSRWLYGDMSDIGPGSRRRKLPSEDRQPPIIESSGPCFSKFLVESDVKLKFCTEDLTTSEPEPVDTITTYSLVVSWQRPVRSQTDESNMDKSSQAKRQSRGRLEDGLRMVITLKPCQAIIDRRPLLKKMKLNGNVSSRAETDFASTSVIGPGEDCDDDSDDNGIIEIESD